jgi:hypothetical protein
MIKSLGISRLRGKGVLVMAGVTVSGMVSGRAGLGGGGAVDKAACVWAIAVWMALGEGAREQAASRIT